MCSSLLFMTSHTTKIRIFGERRLKAHMTAAAAATRITTMIFKMTKEKERRYNTSI